MLKTRSTIQTKTCPKAFFMCTRFVRHPVSNVTTEPSGSLPSIVSFLYTKAVGEPRKKNTRGRDGEERDYVSLHRLLNTKTTSGT